MAVITVQKIDKTGFDLSGALAAASLGGDTLPAVTSGVFVAVENTSGVGRTVTVVSPVTETDCAGFGILPVSDLTIAVADGETQVFKIPFGYRDANGDFPITYDDETGLAIGAFSVP